MKQKRWLLPLCSLALAAALTAPALAVSVPSVSMIPLRSVSESLGWTVTWNDALPGAVLEKDGATAYVILGNGGVIVNDPHLPEDVMVANPKPLSAAPAMLTPGTIYVPADLFTQLPGSYTVSLETDGTITVAPSV